MAELPWLAAGMHVPILFFWSQGGIASLCTVVTLCMGFPDFRRARAVRGPLAADQDRRDLGPCGCRGKGCAGERAAFGQALPLQTTRRQAAELIGGSRL